MYCTMIHKQDAAGAIIFQLLHFLILLLFFLPQTLFIHSPPPAAHHSATPVGEGRTVVFIGGGKSWGPSLIFLLDAVELNWSSFEVTGGIGLSEQRCLHTAVAVSGIGIDGDGDTQRQERDAPSPPSSDPAALEGTASPPAQTESAGDTATTAADEPAAPAVQLWDPVAPRGGGTATPVSARSTGSEKSSAAGAAAATKKKTGAKEGATAAKKTATGSKEAAHAGSSGKTGIDGSLGDHVTGDEVDGGGGPAPVFERILIFGGIVDEAAVDGVSSRREQPKKAHHGVAEFVVGNHAS